MWIVLSLDTLLLSQYVQIREWSRSMNCDVFVFNINVTVKTRDLNVTTDIQTGLIVLGFLS